jgi:hypothetical protein
MGHGFLIREGARVMRLRLLAFVACLIALPLATAQARDPIADAVFTAIERQILADYYRDHRDVWWDDDWHDDDWHDDDWSDNGGKGKKGKKGLPPGLAKKNSLPPGLARQLARNGTLPPGLAKRGLPHELRLRLPRRIDNHEIIFLDERAVLVDRTTNLILDLLTLAR